MGCRLPSNRILPNATKKSTRINFGQYMLVSHCIASSTFDEYDAWIEEMNSTGYNGSGKGSSFISGVWAQFPEHVISSDPFSMTEFSKEVRENAESMNLLFPEGMPQRDQKWKLHFSCADDLAKLKHVLHKVCSRSAQLPVRNRWYTVESFMWNLLFFMIFTATPKLSP